MSPTGRTTHASEILAILAKRSTSLEHINLGGKLEDILGKAPSITDQTELNDKVETLKATTPANTKITLIQGIHVACNRKATHLYVTKTGNTISELDIETLSTSQTYEVAVGAPSPQAFRPDDKQLYINDIRSTNVWLIDTVAQKVIQGANVGSGSMDLTMTPDGKHLLNCGGLANGYLQVIDASNQQLITTIPTDTYPFAVTTRPDGSYAYVACWVDNDGTSLSTIQAFDTTTWRLENSITLRNAVFAMEANPFNNHLYLVNFTGDEFTVIDTTSYEVVKRIIVANQPESRCVSPDGKYVYIASFSSIVTVIDTESLQKVEEINTQKNRLRSIAVSPKTGDVFVTYQD